jgi:hypothetical protein
VNRKRKRSEREKTSPQRLVKEGTTVQMTGAQGVERNTIEERERQLAGRNSSQVMTWRLTDARVTSRRE